MKLLLFILGLILSSAVGVRAQGADMTTHVRIKSCVEAKDSPGNGTRISGPMPIYPWDSARAGVEGETAVRIVVGKDGLPIEVSVLEATSKQFGEAAVVAVKQWKFIEAPAPGKQGPVGLIMECRFVFARGSD